MKTEVPSDSFCCGDQGYYSYSTCYDYEGESYSNVPVCQIPGLSKIYKKKKLICENGCRLVTKETVNLAELAEILKIDNSSFCLSYFCDDLIFEWKLHMDICECKSQEDQDMTPVSEYSIVLRDKNSIISTMGSEVRESIDKPACKDSPKCVRYCCDEGKFWDGQQCSKGNKKYKNVFNLNSTNFEFSNWNEECKEGSENKHLYGDNTDHDGIIKDDGTMILKDLGLELLYGEYCVMGLVDTLEMGDVMVQACLPTQHVFAESEYVHVDFNPSDHDYGYFTIFSIGGLVLLLIGGLIMFGAEIPHGISGKRHSIYQRVDNILKFKLKIRSRERINGEEVVGVNDTDILF